MSKKKKTPLLETEAPLLGSAVRFKIIHSDMKRYYVVEEHSENIICYCGNRYQAEHLVEMLNAIMDLDEEPELIN